MSEQKMPGGRRYIFEINLETDNALGLTQPETGGMVIGGSVAPVGCR